jgi:hypothetical protein
VVLLGAVALIGCEGDQGPVGATGPTGATGAPGQQLLNIVASIAVAPIFKAEVGATFAMSVYNAPSIPHVSLNDTIITFEADQLYEEGRLMFYDIRTMNDTDLAVLNIAYTREDGSAGAASSTISLPGQFSVYTPSESMSPGGEFLGIWSPSAGADAYWIYEHWYMAYTDTGGVDRVIDTYNETVQAGNDSTYYVAWSTHFPDTSEVSTIASFYGNIFIRAVTGPWLPGEANNVTGDAMGVFVGSTASRFMDVGLVDIIGRPVGTSFGLLSGNAAAADERFAQRLREMARQ